MTPPRDTLLDRIMRWAGLARDRAYQLWKWQDDEAIIVSTHSARAWRCTVQQIKDGTEERIDVVEINRETGERVLPEPESYQWQPTIFTNANDEPVIQKDFEQGNIQPAE